MCMFTYSRRGVVGLFCSVQDAHCSQVPEVRGMGYLRVKWRARRLIVSLRSTSQAYTCIYHTGLGVAPNAIDTSDYFVVHSP